MYLWWQIQFLVCFIITIIINHGLNHWWRLVTWFVNFYPLRWNLCFLQEILEVFRCYTLFKYVQKVPIHTLLLLLINRFVYRNIGDWRLNRCDWTCCLHFPCSTCLSCLNQRIILRIYLFVWLELSFLLRGTGGLNLRKETRKFCLSFQSYWLKLSILNWRKLLWQNYILTWFLKLHIFISSQRSIK